MEQNNNNNNRKCFSDNSSACNSNHQFRPSAPVSGMKFSSNSNLIVTQQQQPNRNNTAFNMNPSNTSTINSLEAAKRIASVMQQVQNPSFNLVNRPSQSPAQNNQNTQILMDRQQIIRLAEGSQSDTQSMNNIYQALYLIQQNQLQTAKNKSCQSYAPDVCRPIVSTVHNQQVLNNHSNSLAGITINSTSQDQNATVLKMSNANIQLLEAIGRLNSLQGSKPISHTNVSLIQPDSTVAQQLLNAIQKQCPRSSSGMSSPGFMVIGQTSKQSNVQVSQSNESQNILSTSSSSNNNDFSNSLILKMPINSKAGIPVWTKLLDKLSNNPENLSELNRPNKKRDPEDNQRIILTQPRQLANNEIGHSAEFIQRHAAANNAKQISAQSKPTNNIDNHQILRDSKEISYLMTSSNSMTINNDEMVNMHFQESLRDRLDGKKSSNQLNTNNYKSFELPNGNASEHHKINSKAYKSFCSFIDLEQPEYGIKNLNVATVNHPVSNMSNMGSQLTIKEKADEIIENLLRQSLNSDYIVSRNHHTNATHLQTTIDGKCAGNKSTCQSPIKTCIVNTVTLSSRDNSINNTTTTPITSEPPAKLHNFANSRPYLPLKKRIMLDFQENCDVNIPEKDVNSTHQECKIEMIIPDPEKQNKTPCKRSYNDSSNNDNKIESASNDSSYPVLKKRRGRIPGSGKNQKLKEECRLKEIAKLNLAGTEETWQELRRAIMKPPDIEGISSKTLSALDLDLLKISKEEFFQIGSCTEIAPKMVKCRSCRHNNIANSVSTIESPTNVTDDVSSVKSGSKDSNAATVASSFCRFHGFRKLQFNAKGTLTQTGFCKTNEADAKDLSLWRMYHPITSELSLSMAIYLIETLSSVFCEIIDNESKFLQQCYGSVEHKDRRTLMTKRIQTNLQNSSSKSYYDGFVWKRPVQGVREMCDVCEVSIFNTHWACRKCGYLICLDCYDERNEIQCSIGAPSSSASSQQDTMDQDYDCTKNKTMKNSIHLNTRGASKNRFFSSNHPWAVCSANRLQHNPDQLLKVELIPVTVISELRNRMHTVAKLLQIKLGCNCFSKSSVSNFDLHMLADIALKEIVSSDDNANLNGNLLERQTSTGILRPPPVLSPPHQLDNGVNHNYSSQQFKSIDSKDSIYSWINVSSNIKMLHLHSSKSIHNLKLFQQRWIYGHPVLVSGFHETIDLSFWTPQKFLKEFEFEPGALVEYENGLPTKKTSIKSFMEEFSCSNKPMSSSESGTKPSHLKFKDWSSSDNSNDILPRKCNDILANLPIKEYTTRQGGYNLASHLPEFFVCPDSSPKLHNAYGVPRESHVGTTNLHMDPSDTINIMLFVGMPADSTGIETQNSLECMKEAMVDESIIKAAKTELPGALWHIFLAKDVLKLRQFLNDLLIERGEMTGASQDSIHDQQIYLSQPLLDRLKKSHNIEGCVIVQFQGDAVFIPAGSPYQIRNLHSCMKMSNDFVSPENIRNSLLVTNEVRKLSESHANYEERFQAKNLIFHSIKDAVSTLIECNSNTMTENTRKEKDYPMKRKRYNQTDDAKLIPWCPSSLQVKDESKASMDNAI